MLRQALSTSSRALRATGRIYTPAPLLRSQLQQSASQSLLRPAQLQGLRWYSDQPEQAAKKEGQESKSEADAQAAASADATPVSAEEHAELKKKFEAKEKEAVDWKDKALRTVADFRNLQDRTQREVKTARDFAIQKFAKDLIESVDTLNRALEMVGDKVKGAEAEGAEKDLFNFYEGVKMTESNMLQALARHGMTRFDPIGEKFNPNEHEATFMTPMADKEDNTVFHVQQKGFKLNDRIIRAAQVGVVKNN